IGSRNGGILKLSMKKFGTPIGAGPGSESENAGLCTDGKPLPVGSLLGPGVLDSDFALGFCPEPGLIGLGPPLCADTGWFLGGPERRGGVCVGPVEVVLEVEVELELLVEVGLVVDVVELELKLKLEL